MIIHSIYFWFTDWCYLLKTKQNKSIANQSMCMTQTKQINSKPINVYDSICPAKHVGNLAPMLI